MARIVVDKQTVPHLWAHQSQPEARTPTRNYWFDRETLYSYSTPIGALTSYRGESIALLSANRYSVTTASQLRLARQALPPTVRAVYIQSIPRDSSRYAPESVGALLRSEADRLEAIATEAYRSAAEPKLRAPSIAKRMRQADSAASLYDRFVADNRLGRKPYKRPTVETLGKLAESIAKANANASKRERARIKRQRVEWLAKLAKWRAGELANLPTEPGATYETSRHFLRLDANGRINTSLGVTLPTSAATVRAIVSRLDRLRRLGSIEVMTNEERTIGEWQIVGVSYSDPIAPNDGAVGIGCHRINFSELDRFVETLLSASLLAPSDRPAPFFGSIDPIGDRRRETSPTNPLAV